MILRTLFTATIFATSLAATPALAHDTHVNLGDPLPPGCVRLHVPTPAGKIVHAPPRVRCTHDRVLALRDTRPETPALTPATARD